MDERGKNKESRRQSRSKNADAGEQNDRRRSRSSKAPRSHLPTSGGASGIIHLDSDAESIGASPGSNDIVLPPDSWGNNHNKKRKISLKNENSSASDALRAIAEEYETLEKQNKVLKHGMHHNASVADAFKSGSLQRQNQKQKQKIVKLEEENERLKEVLKETQESLREKTCNANLYKGWCGHHKRNIRKLKGKLAKHLLSYDEVSPPVPFESLTKQEQSAFRKAVNLLDRPSKEPVIQELESLLVNYPVIVRTRDGDTYESLLESTGINVLSSPDGVSAMKLLVNAYPDGILWPTYTLEEDAPAPDKETGPREFPRVIDFLLSNNLDHGPFLSWLVDHHSGLFQATIGKAFPAHFSIAAYGEATLIQNFYSEHPHALEDNGNFVLKADNEDSFVSSKGSPFSALAHRINEYKAWDKYPNGSFSDLLAVLLWMHDASPRGAVMIDPSATILGDMCFQIFDYVVPEYDHTLAIPQEHRAISQQQESYVSGIAKFAKLLGRAVPELFRSPAFYPDLPSLWVLSHDIVRVSPCVDELVEMALEAVATEDIDTYFDEEGIGDKIEYRDSRFIRALTPFVFRKIDIKKEMKDLERIEITLGVWKHLVSEEYGQWAKGRLEDLKSDLAALDFQILEVKQSYPQGRRHLWPLDSSSDSDDDVASDRSEFEVLFENGPFID